MSAIHIELLASGSKRIAGCTRQSHQPKSQAHSLENRQNETGSGSGGEAREKRLTIDRGFSLPPLRVRLDAVEQYRCDVAKLRRCMGVRASVHDDKLGKEEKEKEIKRR